jgi:hypothetical protein
MDKLTNEFDVHSLCTWQTYCDCNICRLAWINQNLNKARGTFVVNVIA